MLSQNRHLVTLCNRVFILLLSFLALLHSSLYSLDLSWLGKILVVNSDFGQSEVYIHREHELSFEWRIFGVVRVLLNHLDRSDPG